ncbi:asparagine synthetase B family protein [Gordonia sp. DT30]|uniref:asparagine synthetase B family protein n=1 Tax=Gordonia sp. DT30 TaxID=3416546 RepID=UPI003CF5D3E6
MVTQIVHRGEVTETYHRPGLAAATRRLPIVDRAHGIQPWREGDLTLCYNGELYNTAELSTALRRESVAPDTDSDTEVVAKAFRVWREDAVDRLEGEFAFAVVEGDRVYVARDPLGVKPLYFAISDGRVHLCSEIKGLLAIGASIHEVPAGHHGWITASGPRLRPYFDVEEQSAIGAAREFTDTPTAIDAVHDAVSAAVDSRLQTDLPVAVVLSGGLDSSIVAAHVARTHPGSTAFTIGTPDSPDIDYAARVARDLGLAHRVITVRPRDISRADVAHAVRNSELTEYGDIINAVISERLFAAIHEAGIKVAIGGDCSDELFGGYPMYDTVPTDQRRELFAHKLGNLSRTELQRVDRSAMASTVEMRVPFLDRRLVTTALRVPVSMKVRDGVEKWVLRRAFENELPDYVIARPKHGLSYSSGLHDRVRLYKPLIPAAYRKCGYDAHAPLRRDFDVALAAAGNDLRAARSGRSLFDDHTMFERGKDLAGALRWNLTGALRSVRK